jgi:hypothetical protein
MQRRQPLEQPLHHEEIIQPLRIAVGEGLLAAFEAQSIPTDPSLLGIDGYKAFLEQRRALVVKRLNEFLGA